LDPLVYKDNIFISETDVPAVMTWVIFHHHLYIEDEVPLQLCVGIVDTYEFFFSVPQEMFYILRLLLWQTLYFLSILHNIWLKTVLMKRMDKCFRIVKIIVAGQ
jgi:hypothetical protein